MANKKQRWTSLRTKAEDLVPREIGNGIIRCRAEYLTDLSITLPEELILDEEQISRDDHAGIRWYRSTEEIRRLLNVEEDAIPEEEQATPEVTDLLSVDGALDLGF